jgi:hypothetical protein
MSTEIAVAFITGVLGPVSILIIKYYAEKGKKKPDMIAETLELSEKVTAKIDNIKEEFESDRVWVAQFHNGGHFYPTGKSMAKFSIIYETVDIGVSSVQNNFQNIPVNLFSKSINYLLEKNIIDISDFKDETIATHGLKYVAEESGCKSAYLFAIKNIENKFIGIMGVDYTKRKTKLSQEEINILTMHASAISGVLV